MTHKSNKQRAPHRGALFFVWLLSTISIPTYAELVDNGGGLYYDTVLDITWSQPGPVDQWQDSVAWAESLTIAGATEWRLPYVSAAAGAGPFTGSPVNCRTTSELDCRDNEIGYMFYYNMGETADTTRFPGLIPSLFWTGTEYDVPTTWIFVLGTGEQDNHSKLHNHFGWAVHPGDVHPDSDGDNEPDNVDPYPQHFNYFDADVAPYGAPDGVVNAADLLIMQRFALGELVASNFDLSHGDLYPPGAPDGVINAQDLVLMQPLLQ